MTFYALTVAERLLDPTTVTKAVPDTDAASLSHGLAGTALLHARLSAVDPMFATAAHRHWTAAAEQIRRYPVESSGIQGGHGGLAASLIIGSPYLPDPETCRARVTGSAQWLANQAQHLATTYSRSTETGPAWHIYDAITGLTGIGRVLLAATQNGHPGVEHGLQSALETLTTIGTPTSNPRPGWWMPPHHHPQGVTVDASGAATTGAAHGIAGPLAFLSTAHDVGWSVPGQTEAIDHVATWLLRWRAPDGSWSPHITGTELDTDSPSTTPGRRDAWCYGTPGITNALHRAGHARNKPEWITEANQALTQLSVRTPHTWDTEGPTLCHGTAGVLQSTARTCLSVSETAAAATIATFNPKGVFGLHHHTGPRVDPGLLTGAAGVALALAEHEHLLTSEVPTKWDSLLILS